MTEKAYYEAIERAKKFYGNGIAEEIFPELKEGDDEKIRRWIIDDIRYNMNNEPLNNSEYKNKAEKAIVWLEKQGKEEYEELISFKDEDVRKFMQYIEKQAKAYEFNLPNRSYDIYAFAKDLLVWLEKQGKNSTDKIEPNFKVGDWVMFIKSKSVYQVEKKENYEYILRHILGGSLCLPFPSEELIREWTIQDAKDGDVLSFYTEYKGSKMVQIGIIEKYVGKCGGCSNAFKIYVGVNWENNLQIGKYMGCSDIYPATKEQRDLLFQKIREAGYKWNDKTKSLEN